MRNMDIFTFLCSTEHTWPVLQTPKSSPQSKLNQELFSAAE